MEQKFLKKETKTFSVVTSVLIGIALMILVIIGLISGNFLGISVIGSSVIVFISAIFMGSMQIRVFSNYKSQKKYLCADGIFYICLTILVTVAGLVFVLVPSAKVDIRYFIFVFAIAFAIWKILISVLGFKRKFYNAFAELIIAFFWLLSGVAVLLTTIVNLQEIGTYLMCVSNYLLGISTIFYILYSYVYKEPDFLITEEAVAILQKENEERANRMARFNSRYTTIIENKPAEKTQESSIEQKLEKLKSLKEKGFITEEEFEKRKKDLLDNEL